MSTPALYVYAIVRGAILELPSSGLEGKPLHAVTIDDLSAVVHTKDENAPYAGVDETVKVWAAEHAGVVERLWETHTAVLPMTFDVIVAGGVDAPSENRLRRWMQTRAGSLRARLDVVAGSCELNVQATLALGCTPAPEIDELDAAISAATPGRRVLLEKKRVQLERAAAALRADALHAEFESDLAKLARDMRSGRPRGGPRSVNVASVALLVDRPRIEEVGALLGSWADRERGLDIAFYGPWPPYSFAELGEPPNAREVDESR